MPTVIMRYRRGCRDDFSARGSSFLASTERKDRERAGVDFYYRSKASSRGNAFFVAEGRRSTGGDVVSRNRARLFAKRFPRIACNSLAEYTRRVDSATAAAAALYAIYIPLLNYNRAPGLPSRGIAD